MTSLDGADPAEGEDRGAFERRLDVKLRDFWHTMEKARPMSRSAFIMSGHCEYFLQSAEQLSSASAMELLSERLLIESIRCDDTHSTMCALLPIAERHATGNSLLESSPATRSSEAHHAGCILPVFRTPLHQRPHVI